MCIWNLWRPKKKKKREKVWKYRKERHGTAALLLLAWTFKLWHWWMIRSEADRIIPSETEIAAVCSSSLVRDRPMKGRIGHVTSSALKTALTFLYLQTFLSSLDTLQATFCAVSEERESFLSMSPYLPELLFLVSVHSRLYLISHLVLLKMLVLHGFSLLPHHCYGCFFFFFLSCLFCRSLTSNLPNVNLPNVNLQIPKVPNLPVPVAGLSVNLPQMPSFSTPSWMAAIYDSECVFN